jgi:hypothetical protein
MHQVPTIPIKVTGKPRSSNYSDINDLRLNYANRPFKFQVLPPTSVTSLQHNPFEEARKDGAAGRAAIPPGYLDGRAICESNS